MGNSRNLTTKLSAMLETGLRNVICSNKAGALLATDDDNF